MKRKRIFITTTLIVLSIVLSSCSTNLSQKNEPEINAVNETTENIQEEGTAENIIIEDQQNSAVNEEETEVHEDYMNPRNAMDLVREVYYSDVPMEDVGFSFHDYIKHIESDEIWYMIQIHNNNSDSAGVTSVAVHPLTCHILSLEEHADEFILD